MADELVLKPYLLSVEMASELIELESDASKWAVAVDSFGSVLSYYLMLMVEFELELQMKFFGQC